MTREEAIKMAKADLKCMERDTSGQDEMCNSHKCDECSLNYERGNMGEQKEWLRMAIQVLEQEPKIGYWIAQDIHNCHTDFKCSECDYIHSFMHLYGKPTADYTYCPKCGAKMEVEQNG